MNNMEKYTEVFTRLFEINGDNAKKLHYQDIEAWDSVGHMTLISELENTFDIEMDADDIIDFESFEKGIELLSKEEYGVIFDA